MAYIHGGTQQPAPLLAVEQVKRRNAAINAELLALAVEAARLDASVQAMRGALSTERRKLTRQIRDMDTTRVQAAQIAAADTYVSTLPPPKFGGPEGLQAAVDEMQAHEYQQLKLGKPRTPKGPSHGTGRKYKDGCRCDDCRAWRTRKTEYTNRQKRKRKQEREKELAA